MSKVWFITGCSSGFGHEIALAALSHGDTVIATARSLSALTELASLGATVLALDVTATDSQIEAVIAQAIKLHHHIDILVNNAGVVLAGAIEETSDVEAKTNFNINVFGTLAVTRAVLPYMRARRTGVVAAMGSVGGWMAMEGAGIYCATKWALAGIFGALKKENEALGIDVCLLEPGYFRTKLLSSGNRVVTQKRIAELDAVIDPVREGLESHDGKQLGDPQKGAQLIVEALTKSGRCEGRQLPWRLGMGSDSVQIVGESLELGRKEMEDWKELSLTTDF
jgi:NADP-dependent 3-hydroxy acid dehydrogenase YdfG